MVTDRRFGMTSNSGKEGTPRGMVRSEGRTRFALQALTAFDKEQLRQSSLILRQRLLQMG